MILIGTVTLIIGLCVGSATVLAGGLYFGAQNGCPYCRDQLGLR